MFAFIFASKLEEPTCFISLVPVSDHMGVVIFMQPVDQLIALLSMPPTEGGYLCVTQRISFIDIILFPDVAVKNRRSITPQLQWEGVGSCGFSKKSLLLFWSIAFDGKSITI